MAISTAPARRSCALGETDDPGAGVRPASAVVALSLVVAALATIAAGTGLLSTGGDAPATVTSVHGETVDLDPRGGVYKPRVKLRASNPGEGYFHLSMVRAPSWRRCTGTRPTLR
jgi:hypothetical protein